MSNEAEVVLQSVCEEVRKRSTDIAALILARRYDDAGRAAVSLCSFATQAKEQRTMRQEQAAGAYDLNALRVDTSAATDSETPERWHDGPLPPTG